MVLLTDSNRANRFAVVLAAGKGTRFLSETPKALHALCGRPMVSYLLQKLQDLDIGKTVVVVGHGADQVREALREYDVEFVNQTEQLGTGHAVQCALPAFSGASGSLLVVYADTVLIEKETLRKLIELREAGDYAQTFISMELDDPAGYGRVVRQSDGSIRKIVEDKDADSSQKKIREINAGFNCFSLTDLRENIQKLDADNRKGEYYLTDMVEIFVDAGYRVGSLVAESLEGALGINTWEELARASRALRRLLVSDLQKKGVIFVNPKDIYLDSTVKIGSGTRIYPGVVLEGQTEIGSNCTIGNNSHLRNARLADRVNIDHTSIVRDSEVGADTTVGPFAHLRNGCIVGSHCHIGNFVEMKQTTFGDQSKAVHLTYLGNCRVGKKVNIGAGTITCNYDGRNKLETIIEDEVFIGSNSQLIAPVRVSRGAYVAAGSTITEDVPSSALAIARSRQQIKEGWVEKRSTSQKDRSKK